MKWHFYNSTFEYEDMYLDLGGAWSGHKYFGYDLVRNLKPRLVVELGVHLGCSIFSFSQAVKDGKLSTQTDGIDTWKGDQNSGYYSDVIFKRVHEIKNSCYPNLKINFVKTTFNKACKKYPEKSIDILHIDGLHTYKAVKHDFDNWVGKVKNDGIILLHDISVKQGGVGNHKFGVYKLWEEIKKKYQTLEFTHSYGLGVVFKKSKACIRLSNPQIIFNLYYPIMAEKRDLEWHLKKALIETKTNQGEINSLKKEYERLKGKIQSHPLYPAWKLYKKITDLV